MRNGRARGRTRHAGARRPTFLLALLLAAGVVGPRAAAAVAVHSRSGQFIVQSPQPTPPTLSRVSPPSTNALVALHPDPLAVSAERIKAAVLAELGWPDRWKGKVFLAIEPRAAPVLMPVPTARRYADGWQYGLRLPQQIEGPALIRGVVHVLLLEMANRSPGPQVPEVPVWLVEALTGQVLARIGPDPLAAPNSLSARYGRSIGELVSTLRERALVDEEREIIDRALSGGLPSFEDLSLPGPAQLRGAEAEKYRACCQVLFVSLRGLPRGEALLGSFLSQLPQHLNWQTAFLSAYSGVFPRLLDVEKWWALVALRVHAARGRVDIPARTALGWIEDLCVVEVEVRESPQVPVRREMVSLQRVITDWPFARQSALLKARQSQFRLLAARAPEHLRGLAQRYADALEEYVQHRARLGWQPGLPGQAQAEFGHILRTVTAHLEALDVERAVLAGRATRANPAPALTPAPYATPAP